MDDDVEEGWAVRCQQKKLLKLDTDCLRKMIFFRQSDEEILAENLNIVVCENERLREQLDDLEREVETKDRKIKEMESELKLLRGDREQFVEMGVRLEI